MKTISAEEFKKRYGTQGVSMFSPQPKDQKPGFGERLKQSAMAGFNKIKEGGSQVDAGVKSGNPSPLPLLEGGLKIGAGAVETLFSPLTAAAQPVIQPTVGRAVEFAADKISDSPQVQQFSVSQAGEILSRITEDINNLNTMLSAVVGPKGVNKVTGAALDTTSTTITQAANQAAARASQLANKVAGPLKGFAGGVKNVTEMALDGAKQIPSNIATNMAERQAFQQTIQQLPTKVAQKAAEDGLDVADVQSLYQIPKSQSSQLKQLAQTVKDFVTGKTKTNPIEVVGRPIVERIRALESERGVVGQKLGKIAENLGEVTTKEVFPPVLEELKLIPGLNGLTVSKKGILDFTDTVLSTKATAADRAAIQDMFLDAIKAGTGKRKHLLRQELFEILDGKKRSLSNLTATQEQAFDAIRSGLSRVLEGKNNGYRVVSAQYRKLMDPLRDIRKFMKSTVGVSEDILEMKAGLLARRLTSFAASNPEIRAILKAMDNATTKAGKTQLSVETLQDFYNILEKYYDIAPKTGFQAQVTRGVESATSISGFALEQLKGLAGQTAAVRQKALEKILEEIFR